MPIHRSGRAGESARCLRGSDANLPPVAPTLFWLDPDDHDAAFPPPARALREPNGLLAVGGDLSPERLLRAYRHGIFPWYSEGQPILWWSPDPRAVLFPKRLRVPRSLRKRLRRGDYRVSLDRAFRQVMRCCAEPRPEQEGTWITPAMLEAYGRLHDMGVAHSAETWVGEELVGGLYGVALGRVFFGESMFSRRTDASKVAFHHLVRQLESWGFALIDGQVPSPHLYTLGMEDVARADFLVLLDRWCELSGHAGPWRFDSAG